MDAITPTCSRTRRPGESGSVFCDADAGDKVLGMNLDHGGHLTHGSPVNLSGKYFEIVSYGVNNDGFIDYDKVREIALKERPKLIIAGASAYARTIDFKRSGKLQMRRGLSYGGYGAHCRPCGSRASSKPHPLCSCDDNHDAQDAEGAKGRNDAFGKPGGAGDV